MCINSKCICICAYIYVCMRACMYECMGTDYWWLKGLVVQYMFAVCKHIRMHACMYVRYWRIICIDKDFHL